MPDDTYRKAGRPTKQQSIALARALLGQTKAGLCSHGVPAQHCAEHDPARQPAPQEAQP
ncbi:MAG: hypothetical protein ACRD0P_19585 [Stackebrandtia sp.]